MTMECEQTFPKIDINHNNFPAKLWRLTNSPQNSSLFWSRNGDFLMVDRQRFEMDLLSPHKPFKSSNFSSFIRQLNLYGFRKVFHGPAKDRPRNLHLFHSPHFRRGRPELLVHLKRLTLSNRAKMESGEQEPVPRAGRERHRAQKTGPAHGSLRSTGRSRQMKEFERSPIPGPSWILPGIPLSVIHPYPYTVPRRAQSSPAVIFPQDSRYVPHQMPYPAGFYSSVVCPCCSGGFMDADRAGGDPTSLSYSHYAYYPQNYSMNPNSFQCSSWPANAPCESQRGDLNLDRVFQMVDDLQGLPDVHIVRVGTPVKEEQRSQTPPSSSRNSPSRSRDSDHQRSQTPPFRSADLDGQRSQTPSFRSGDLDGQRSQTPSFRSGDLDGQRSQTPPFRSGDSDGQRSQTPPFRSGDSDGQRSQTPSFRSEDSDGQRSQTPSFRSGDLDGQRSQTPLFRSGDSNGQMSDSLLSSPRDSDGQKSDSLLSSPRDSDGQRSQTPPSSQRNSPFRSRDLDGQRSDSPPSSPRESDGQEDDSSSFSQKAFADQKVTKENISI